MNNSNVGVIETFAFVYRKFEISFTYILYLYFPDATRTPTSPYRDIFPPDLDL